MASPCPRCKKSIAPGLKFQTDGNGLRYHAKCFTCLACKILIQGPFYTFEQTVYCPTCFTTKTAATCALCNQAIGVERLTLNGKTLHPHCFTCTACKRPISGASFMDQPTGPMCTPCYTQNVAPKCKACAKPISAVRITTADGTTCFHKECFVCHACRKELSDYFVSKADDRLYCAHCYMDKMAPKCGACDESVATSYVQGKDGKAYHPTCHRNAFHPRCAHCRNFLPEMDEGRIRSTMIPGFDHLYCPSHATDGTPQCFGCERFTLVNKKKQMINKTEVVLCDACRPSVVSNGKTLDPLYASLISFFTLTLSLPLHPIPPVKLVPAATLLEAQRQGGGRSAHIGSGGRVVGTTVMRMEHVTESIPASRIMHHQHHQQQQHAGSVSCRVGEEGERVTVRRVGKCEMDAILVLAGLPRARVGAVLAHELMHVHLAQQGYHRLVSSSCLQGVTLLPAEGGGGSSPQPAILVPTPPPSSSSSSSASSGVMVVADGNEKQPESPFGLPLVVEEGLCELASFLWLEHEEQSSSSPVDELLSARRAYMQQNPNPIYGQGFRDAHRAYLNMGLKELLAHTRRTGGVL